METPPELDNERILGLARHPFENSLLGQSVLELLVRQNVAFRDGLERIQGRRLAVSHKKNLKNT